MGLKHEGTLYQWKARVRTFHLLATATEAIDQLPTLHGKALSRQTAQHAEGRNLVSGIHNG